MNGSKVLVNGDNSEPSPDSFCEACLGTGVVVYPNKTRPGGAGYADLCECVRPRTEVGLMRSAGLNAVRDLWKAKAKEFRNETDGHTKAYKAARVVYRVILNGKPNRKRGAWFWGPIATGKTYLAVAMINGLIRHGKQAYFITVRDVVNFVNEHAQSSETYNDYLRDLKRNKLLVLDDFAAQRVKEDGVAMDALNGLLGDFHNRHEPPYLVITSNEKPAAALAMFGVMEAERLMSRLRTGMEFVEFGEPV